MSKAGAIETFSFNVVDGISGLRKIAAFVICSALLCACMYFNGQYGYLLASGEEWVKWIMVGLYAALDASLVYISCVTHKVARKYGKWWNALYVWCAVLTLCSIFTCVAYFSANSTAQKNAQANEINSAITLSASAIVQSSAASSTTMGVKLGDTHNNTTKWHELKQIDDANALEGLRALQIVKKDIEGQQIASEAVFSDMGIEDKKILIRQCFGFVIAITATIMCILLSLDKAETAERIGNTGTKTNKSKTLNSKGKTKSQSQSTKKTTLKNAPDIKTHDDYDRVRQAVLSQSLPSPKRADLIKLKIGGTTATAMQKEFAKQGLIKLGTNGYEYINKEMRVV